MSKCDIIVPIWNQLEVTKACLKSICENTHIEYKLILIDNASDKETRDYLEVFSAEAKAEVTLIRNERNLGALKALNQGMRLSNAEFVCLLNNDTEVSEGWLAEMLKVAGAREDIGAVNPNSNTLGRKPKRGQSLQSVAQELKSYTGKWSELALASGFCMLIKRKVIQQAGLFDEVYGIGYFEDSDYSKRVQQLGYRCVCATAAYVYHHEKSSFIKFKKFDQNFKRNRQIFFAKWGRIQRILYVLTKDSPVYMEKINAEVLKLARQGHVIWVFLPSRVDFPNPFKGKVLKDKNREKINAYLNTKVYKLPRTFFNLVTLWRILKRKKRFDKIYVDDENYAKRLNNFGFIHRAKVIYVQ